MNSCGVNFLAKKVGGSTPSGSSRGVGRRLFLPSLPCGELITEVTDESGSQQLAVTDTLQKLRMSRDGTPIDLPERIEWGHVIAPAFQQRKVVGLMEEAQQFIDISFHRIEQMLNQFYSESA